MSEPAVSPAEPPEGAGNSYPTAITGTWSDMERHALYLYDNPEVAQASEWEMAEAVLVLLGTLAADSSVSPADTPDYEAIRLRAQAQLSHFGTGTGTGVPSCDRCGKPTNRWDEPCDYMQTAAALLAEDVVALLAVGERREQHIERLTEAATALLDQVRLESPEDWEGSWLISADVLAALRDAVLADKEDAE